MDAHVLYGIPRRLTLVASGVGDKDAEHRGRRENFLMCPLKSYILNHGNVISGLKNKIKLKKLSIQQNPCSD